MRDYRVCIVFQILI